MNALLTRWLMRRRVARLKRYEASFLKDAEKDSGLARQVGLYAAADMRARRVRVEAALGKAKGRR